MNKSHMAAFAAAAALSLAACSTPTDTTNDEPLATADQGTGAGAGLSAVYTEVEGLDREARRSRLIELAQEEGGTVSLYTSMGTEITEPLVAAFTEDFDLQIELYRAGSETVLQRVLQEVSAGRPGFDVIETNGPQIAAAAREDALSAYDSPYEDDLVEGAEFDLWTATRLLNFHVSWNADLVAQDEAPKSWTDLADDTWNDRLAMEIGDVDWYKTLYEYLLDSEGMSEAEIDDMFRAMASNAAFLDGHSLMGQTLASGEYAVASSNYLYVTLDLMRSGAPVAYEPIVEPLIVRPNGAAISVDPPHPASAVLLMDWLLTDGQDVLAELGLSPARSDLNATGDVETVFVDIDGLLDELDEWTSKYEALVSVGEVVPE